MKNYKYILFDLDGTLTDPSLGITKSVEYALKKFEIPVGNRGELEKFIGPPLINSFMEFYDFDKEKAVKAVAAKAPKAKASTKKVAAKKEQK